VALTSGSLRELIEIEIKEHPKMVWGSFARPTRLGNCPEIHVSPGGTGFAARRLHSSIVSVWLRRQWGCGGFWGPDWQV